ncbi:hypothetical protein PIIN_11250 [Serendipita indica DSM 11827]|uniref:Uncharacterized protein n=1 Tax=Serendipita indica (strain DSM 11827) TaxID=1109443 RepID=G4U129_SERID|nr:hypothetical protein PIIN_11250 [Serendipita indica DSM 11827]
MRSWNISTSKAPRIGIYHRCYIDPELWLSIGSLLKVLLKLNELDGQR